MDGDRLDWDRHGLSPRARRVCVAATEAMLSDEDDDGHLIPGRPEVVARGVSALDAALGRGSPDLRRGFAVLCVLLQWLPLVVIGKPARLTSLSLAERLHYLESLESSRFGLFSMLLVAFKVPICIPAFEDPEELASTGFDRPSTVARRRLPLAEEAAS